MPTLLHLPESRAHKPYDGLIVLEFFNFKTSHLINNSATNYFKSNFIYSVLSLSPLNSKPKLTFSFSNSKLWACCYALINSQLFPGLLTLNMLILVFGFSLNLSTLYYNLGCFPLDIRSLHLMSHYKTIIKYFFTKYLVLTLIHIKYPLILNFTLYLDTFRREPAITKFDWIITPIYRSSQNFATFTSTVYDYP